MIYNCQHCPAHLSVDMIRAAMQRNENFVVCKYCGGITEFREIRSSHIARGYDFLSDGNFTYAQTHFLHAIEDARRHGKRPSPDVYLGQALVQFQVQTLFSDEDTQRLEPPQLICHTCNEMHFADSELYLMALECIERDVEPSMQFVEKVKMQRFAAYIDAVKDHYDAIKASKPAGFLYDTFIAYEDKAVGPDAQGFEVAHKVRNQLPDEVRHTFLPDIEEYGSEEEYDAAILHAINHSKCMLVITDNDIDFRLTNIYSRFFNTQRKKQTYSSQSNLGFVRYCGHITITLPDATIARDNVFDLDKPNGFIKFVCLHNNIVWNNRVAEDAADAAPEPEVASAPELAPLSPSDALPYTYMHPNQYAFGHYPQRRETSAAVEQHFMQYGMPTAANSKGWNVMFINKKGVPYTWYRDDTVDGKKYRAVYFSKFRDVYSVQDSKIPAKEQRAHGYLPMHLYCFAYESLIWNIEDLSTGMAVLVSDQGLDSREYNDHDMDNLWEHSTMHSWLNSDFLNTAFDENEREYLCTVSGTCSEDKVFIIDKLFDKKYYEGRHNAIMGSDYYKCIGGMGDKNINSYWVTANDNLDEREAAVIFPQFNRSLSTRYVDCTIVAVLPKIVLRLK